MEREKTIEELKAENAELKATLSKVLQAYDILDSELKEYRKKHDRENSDATISSSDDVKKILEKYSRI